MKKKVISVLLAASMICGLLGGCGGEQTEKTGKDIKEYLKTAQYPVEVEQELNVWSYRGGNSIGDYIDPKTMPYLETMKKATGVSVNWDFATPGQEKQQLNLLLSSGEIPDIIISEWAGNSFPGGADKAIKDGYIAELNDLIPDYMPNYNKYLEKNKNAAKELKTDAGSYYYIPSYVTDEEQGGFVSAGYMFRKDWLDELDLPVPETIDEWYTTLKAFKDSKKATIPLTIVYQMLTRGLSGAYGIYLGLYKEENQVKYGYAEPAYRDFLTEMNKWYKEGLLDNSLATVDAKSIDAKIINGNSGATFGWLFGGMARWTAAAREKTPSFELVGVPYPVMNKGDMPTFGSKDPVVYFGGSAIGGKSENKELAMKFLDYGFTDEGRELYTFGEENKTFIIEDGKYKFTDLIEKNPDGLTKSEAKSAYIRNTEYIPLKKGYNGMRAEYQDEFDYEEMTQAQKTWSYNDVSQSILPFTLTPKPEESSDYARIQTEIDSFCQEMLLKFIIGEEPLENFDQYIEELKERGLDKMMKITQDSYDRYLGR